MQSKQPLREKEEAKETWSETIRNDLKIYNFIEEIAITVTEWKDGLHRADPIGWRKGFDDEEL